MKVDTRWLDWRAPQANGEPSETAKMNSVIFVTSLFSQNPNISVLEAEPAACQGAFDAWLLAHCVFRDRAWGGIGELHRDYVRWCEEKAREVPAGLATFSHLLSEVGSYGNGEGLIYGILLREDWESRTNDIP